MRARLQLLYRPWNPLECGSQMGQSALSHPFWSKATLGPECWEWQAARFKNGYGAVRFNGRTTYAHRVAYELSSGVNVTGLEVHHRCRNRACVNPDHLEAMTKREHRGLSKPPTSATHCRNGHLLAEHALRPGSRQCRQCNRDRTRLFQRERYRRLHPNVKIRV